MKFNETELIEFFGVPPLEENPEEKEFFGSSAFEVVRGQVTLRISFSTHSPKVIADLLLLDGDSPIMNVSLYDASKVRVDTTPRRLVVLGRAEGEKGSDPQLVEKLSIHLDPLKVDVTE